MSQEELPKKLLYMICECGQKLTVESDNSLLRTGGLECPRPDCSHILGPDDIAAEYSQSDTQ